MAIVKSDNTKGNPYHKSEDGRFTSPNDNSGNGFGDNGSISVVPKMTSQGKPRKFFADYSQNEKEEIFNQYRANYGQMSDMINKLGLEYPTIAIKSETRELLRQKMLQDEFDSQNSLDKKANRKATIVLGLPGSGKSRIANILSKQDGAFIIDADEFKKRIPEFQKDSLMLSAVHEESVDLSNKFRNELSNQGYNMIIGKVGGDIESVDYVVKELAKKNYDIEVILNDVPLETALDRTIGRFSRKETDRLVPLHTLLNADGNIFSVFDYLIQHPNVKRGRVYSNDVPKDQNLVLLKEYNK